jgi:hypothetical protein
MIGSSEQKPENKNDAQATIDCSVFLDGEREIIRMIINLLSGVSLYHGRDPYDEQQ